MHVEVEENGRNDRALWHAEVDISMSGKGVLEKNLLFSTVEIIADEFGNCVGKGGAEEFDF